MLPVMPPTKPRRLQQTSSQSHLSKIRNSIWMSITTSRRLSSKSSTVRPRKIYKKTTKEENLQPEKELINLSTMVDIKICTFLYLRYSFPWVFATRRVWSLRPRGGSSWWYRYWNRYYTWEIMRDSGERSKCKGRFLLSNHCEKAR